MNDTRLHFLDYGRVFCILGVCLVHSGFEQITVITNFLMPFFFFLAGYTFNPNKYDFSSYVTVRFKRLIYPFWLFLVFYSLLNVLRQHYFSFEEILTTSHTLIGGLISMLYGSFIIPHITLPEQPYDFVPNLGSQLWFLPAMFSGCVIFYPLAKMLSKNFSVYKSAVVTTLLLALACTEVEFPCLYQLPWGIGRGFYASATMLFGYFIRQKCDFDTLDKKNGTLVFFVSAAFWFVSVFTDSTAPNIIASNYGKYGSLSLVLSWLGVSGILLLIMFCRKLDKLNGGREIKWLSRLGKDVVWIYLLHHIFIFLCEVLFYKIGLPLKPDEFYAYIFPWEESIMLHIFEVIAIFFGPVLLKRIFCK